MSQTVTVVLVDPREEQMRAREVLDNKQYKRATDGELFRIHVAHEDSDSSKNANPPLVLSLTSRGTIDDLRLAAQEARRLFTEPSCRLILARSFPEESLMPTHVASWCVHLYRYFGARLFFLGPEGFVMPSVFKSDSAPSALTLHLCTLAFPPLSHIPLRQTWVTRVVDRLTLLLALPTRDPAHDPLASNVSSCDAPFQPFGGTSNVYLERPGVVAKGIDTNSAAVALHEFAQQNTTIPIPRLLPKTTEEVMLMERIPGKVLADCWSDLGWWKRFRISCTLRSYFAQLRRLSSHITGPPTQPGTASGALFDMITFGTFRSLDAFQYWCHIVALDGDLLFPDQHKDNVPPPWFTDQELGNWVFTPGDLHQCNLILGDDGRLWVIDWDYAGF